LYYQSTREVEPFTNNSWAYWICATITFIVWRNIIKKIGVGDTTREKLISGVPQRLILGEFGFTDDLHSGGNVLPLANNNSVLGDQTNTVGKFTMCAGHKSYPRRTRKEVCRDKNSTNSKKYLKF
jgi:hypothetical protein